MLEKLNRCPWPKGKEEDIKYHDTEWGVPVHDDRKLFEFIILDGFQAGLSWSLILKKRGFKFVGTTICYAFMQAAGMVNDHMISCFRYDEVGSKQNP